MHFWLARHARPLVAPGTCYGAMDVEADPVHTHETAVRLASLLPTGARVWTSPLRRCRSLADELHALRPDLRPRIEERLREMDFGVWEGCAWDAIPQSAFDAWTGDFLHERFGGADSVVELMQRVRSAWQEACSVNTPLIWVTHAGVIRSLALVRMGKPLPKMASDWPREVLDFGGLAHWDLGALTDAGP